MSSRYFAHIPITGDRAVLTGAEAHHLVHVMRAEPGMQVTLFDGSGAEFPARIERLRRTKVELTVLGREQVDRELPFELTLAVALPKGDRQKWLVEKSVELGVTRIVPLRTSRSVAQPVGQAVARLRRTVIEASKQCGRNRLMEIAAPRAWADLVDETRGLPCRLVAHPHHRAGDAGQPAAREIFRPAGTSGGALLAVGPEGGFTPEEIGLATAAGWTPVDLGQRTLRIETAALLLVGLIAGECQFLD